MLILSSWRSSSWSGWCFWSGGCAGDGITMTSGRGRWKWRQCISSKLIIQLFNLKKKLKSSNIWGWGNIRFAASSICGTRCSKLGETGSVLHPLWSSWIHLLVYGSLVVSHALCQNFLFLYSCVLWSSCACWSTVLPPKSQHILFLTWIWDVYEIIQDDFGVLWHEWY